MIRINNAQEEKHHLNRHLTEKETTGQSTHEEMFTSLLVRKVQIKTKLMINLYASDWSTAC